MISVGIQHFPLGPNGPSNVSGESSDDDGFNRQILEQLADAVIHSSDAALGITILSNQPINQQDKYVEAIIELWDSRKKLGASPSSKMDHEIAIYRFLKDVATSTTNPFSFQARDNAEYFLGSNRFSSIRGVIEFEGSAKLPVGAKHTFQAYKNMLHSGMEKYPVKRIQEAYSKIKSDNEFFNVVNQTIESKSLAKLISYGISHKAEPKSYLVASLIYLCETSNEAQVNKLFKTILAHADIKESLVEEQEKVWARPKTLFVSDVLKDLINCVHYLPLDLKHIVSSKLSLPTFLIDTKSLLSEKRYSMSPFSDISMDKLAMSVEAIVLEEEFKDLDNDLNSYFMLPIGFAYELRVESKFKKPEAIESLVNNAINSRCSDMDAKYRNKIISLLKRDLNLKLQAA